MPAAAVVSRDAELLAVDSFLTALASGFAALVLRGEPGIGKTTIWRAALERARTRDIATLASQPSQVEAGLAFAGLADLLTAAGPETLRLLPEPQSAALQAALLRVPAPAEGIDERAVLAGVLSLVRLLAREQPLLIAVDDLQWLDRPSARALEYALRRLDGQRIGLLASIRGGGESRLIHSLSPSDVRMVEVEPLTVAGLHALFNLHLGHSFPRPVLVGVARVSAGNPLYALEIGRELDRRPSGGLQVPVPESLGALVRARVARLPAVTRRELLKVACLRRPAPPLVDLAALVAAEEAGIVALDRQGVVRFEHPLLASAVYAQATEPARREAHAGLAAVVADPEERGRHLALASTGPDAAVAQVLEDAAGRAAARGAPSAAAELVELALELTPSGDADARLRRQLALGEHLFGAGATHRARETLEEAASGAASSAVRGEALFRLGWLVQVEGDWEAGVRLLERALEDASDARLAGRVHALLADAYRTDLPRGIEHAEAALALLDEAEDPGICANVLQHLAEARLLAGQGADHALIERSLPLQRQTSVWELTQLAAAWARGFDDFETARRRFAELILAYEEGGLEPELPSALAHLATVELWTGNWGLCETLARRALELSEQTEQPMSACIARYPLALVLAHRGRVEEARDLAEMSLAAVRGRPEQILRAQAYAALGFVELSLERFEAAAQALDRADDQLTSIGWLEPFHFRFYGDQLEAAVELGRLERADRLVTRLEQSARRIPRPWIGAVAARGRALVLAAGGDLEAGLARLDLALACHERLEMPFERGRMLLHQGRLLRRHRQGRAAAGALDAALACFESLGAPLWAERARAELARIGRPGRRLDLTQTERRVAELALSGLSNREIAERAFLTVKAVEANLTRVYRKLGIRSRVGLAGTLEAATTAADARVGPARS
jgi:DNA-binding CsgD family transcriptional regulator